MFEWVLGAVIGIILLGFVGWIPAIIGYALGCVIGAKRYHDTDSIAGVGFAGALMGVIFVGLPITTWLGHEIVIRLL